MEPGAPGSWGCAGCFCVRVASGHNHTPWNSIPETTALCGLSCGHFSGSGPKRALWRNHEAMTFSSSLIPWLEFGNETTEGLHRNAGKFGGKGRCCLAPSWDLLSLARSLRKHRWKTRRYLSPAWAGDSSPKFVRPHDSYIYPKSY